MKHLYIFLKWLAALAVIVLLFAAWLFDRDRAPACSPMGEQVTDNEPFLTSEIIRMAIDTSVQQRAHLMENTAKHVSPPPSSEKTAPGYRPDAYRRDAHPKGHGCVAATFKVDRVEDRFAFGVFAQPGQYDALIRFSSGSPTLQPDFMKDARGMAVKLFNVPGKKLLPFEEDDTTQDFTMMNNPVFFIRTLEEYAQFNQMLAYGNPKEYFIDPTGNPLKWHLRELWLGTGTQKPRPDSLATTRFYSASAYALGPNGYVKYSAVPCSSNKVMPPDAKQSKEFDYDYSAWSWPTRPSAAARVLISWCRPRFPARTCRWKIPPWSGMRLILPSSRWPPSPSSLTPTTTPRNVTRRAKPCPSIPGTRWRPTARSG